MHSVSQWLIRRAEIDFLPTAGRTRLVDVRIADGRIATMATAGSLSPQAGEAVIDAAGTALLPGLHDHHLHLAALAVALESLPCGPPQVMTATALAEALQTRAAQLPAGGWLRGIGYHASVAGEIDRAWLDRVLPQHPVRIQQRSGRLWIVNSLALQQLLALADASALPPGLEMRNGQLTGRLLDADDWLRSHLPPSARGFPSLRQVGQRLAAHGITGITDATAHNDLAHYAHFVAAHAAGELAQEILLMGDASLDCLAATTKDHRVRCGPLKLHLHEHALPDFAATVASVVRSHAAGRAMAAHCVTLAELVFALAVLEAAGAHPGDRIEHAAITPPAVLPLLQARAVTVVTQPNFIFERGDVYRQEVAADELPWLYRLGGLQAAGIPLAGGVDAPFGELNPWAAMQAAVDRCTRQGMKLGANEALAPEAALALFLAPLDAPGAAPRRLEIGAPADLCLLDRNWARARRQLAAVQVVATLKTGRLIHGNAENYTGHI
ncbi:MAG: amidohydrolase family protein [Sterolibacterium sp.]|nr:amidohydrolase family protein [Sterolibacterium sp.]